MIIVFGLGNPGLKYKKTRHNLGHRVVEGLCRRFRKQLRKVTPHAYGTPVFRRKGEEVVLARSTTYMNSSGVAAREVLKKYKTGVADLLVVRDDMDLELGRIRLRRGGGHGGHRGQESIADSLGSKDFPRLRLGIGTVGEGEDIDFVLGRFTRDEEPLVDKMVRKACDAVETLIHKGWDRAMNEYNQDSD